MPELRLTTVPLSSVKTAFPEMQTNNAGIFETCSLSVSPFAICNEITLASFGSNNNCV